MKKLLSILALLVGLAIGVQAQTVTPIQTNQIQMPIFTVNLAPIVNANVMVVGNPGNGRYCYWLVTNYLVGSLSPVLAGCADQAPTSLSGSNYDAIFWDLPQGATSVDVLRNSSRVTPPAGACNCAVATGVTSTTVNDQSNSLSSYTVNPFNPASLSLTLANEVQGNGSSHLILRQNGVIVTDLSTAGTGGGNVVGPLSSANTEVAVYSGLTGKLLGNSGVLMSALAPLASPAFTGAPTAPTPILSDSSTRLGTTAFVVGYVTAQGFAPLASPTFTGTVTFPDGSTNSASGWTFASPLNLNSTQLADSGTLARLAANNNFTGSTNTFTGGTLNSSVGFQCAGAAVSGNYLRGNGSVFCGGAIQAGDVPTLNQNTTGTAQGAWLSATPTNTPTGTQFFGIIGRQTPQGAGGAASMLAPRNLTVTGISVGLTAAEGAAATLAFTLDTCTAVACGSPSTTTVTCTVGNSATTCSASGLSVAVTAGQGLVVQQVQTGTGTSAAATVAITFI